MSKKDPNKKPQTEQDLTDAERKIYSALVGEAEKRLFLALPPEHRKFMEEIDKESRSWYLKAMRYAKSPSINHARLLGFMARIVSRDPKSTQENIQRGVGPTQEIKGHLSAEIERVVKARVELLRFEHALTVQDWGMPSIEINAQKAALHEKITDGQLALRKAAESKMKTETTLIDIQQEVVLEELDRYCRAAAEEQVSHAGQAKERKQRRRHKEK